VCDVAPPPYAARGAGQHAVRLLDRHALHCWC
jgi:hypothetical protein